MLKLFNCFLDLIPNLVETHYKPLSRGSFYRPQGKQAGRALGAHLTIKHGVWKTDDTC